MSAKFRKQIKEIAETAPSHSARAGKGIAHAAALALDQVRLLADVFFSKPLKSRQAAAREVQQLAPLLTVADLISLSESPLPGERVAAGIAIREHMIQRPALAEDQDVIAAIERGLADPLSRVRYRFVRAAAAAPVLLTRFRQIIETIARDDSDVVVREEAARFIPAG